MSLLQEFIHSFNQFESDAKLFSLRNTHGLPWWDLVRFQVQYALCVENNIYRNRRILEKKTKGIFVALRRLLILSWRLFCDIINIQCFALRRPKLIVVYTRSLSLDDIAIVAESERNKPILLVNTDGSACSPHAAIHFQSIDLLVRILGKFQRLSPNVLHDVNRISALIGSYFKSDLDFFAIITKKYREEMASRLVWSLILRQFSAVNKVVYINNDKLKSLVVLSREKGLCTYELQHGYIGSTHIGYSYPKLNGLVPSLPHWVIVKRNTGDIGYPVKQLFIYPRSVHNASNVRDIDVLIGVSPTYRMETVDIIRVMVGKGYRLAVKLHPSDNNQRLEIERSLRGGDYKLYAGSDDFCWLASRSCIYIPSHALSTTVFEAIEMGAFVISVNYHGNAISAAVDGLASVSVETIQDLPLAVWSHLSAIKKQRLSGVEVDL